MHPSGKQLREITELIEAGKIRPIIDKVFDFKETQKPLNTLKVEEQRQNCSKMED